MSALLLASAVQAASVLTVDLAAHWQGTSRTAPTGLPSTIQPVGSRLNLWLPWKRWSLAHPPVFEPYISEAALIMATGARPDGEFSVPDLYRDSSGVPGGFPDDHPLFTALRILKAKGIRPILDIGPVPIALSATVGGRPGPFQWNVDAPADYRKYHAYIRSLFTHLHRRGGFTLEEMNRWGYQLGREPDNHASWDPRHTGRDGDRENLEEYKRLYDCTLAGLRDAGLEVNLMPGNLMIPQEGVLGARSTWIGGLYSWIASGKDNRCPEHLVLPRIRSRQDTLEMGFSAYAGPGVQMGLDPREVGRLTWGFREILRRHFPENPLRITVAEGNLFRKNLLHRSEGGEFGAAWLAGLLKTAQDVGLARYQLWGLVSADHISKFMEHGGAPAAPHNVALMYRKMEGERRAAVSLVRGLRLPGSYVDALASVSDSGDAHVLAYNFASGPLPGSRENLDVKILGLKPGRRYVIRHHRVDSATSNYLPRWHRDLATSGLALESPYDACMEHQFTAKHREIWERRKAEYLRLSRLGCASGDSLSSLVADTRGTIRKRIRLIPNSVSLLEIR